MIQQFDGAAKVTLPGCDNHDNRIVALEEVSLDLHVETTHQNYIAKISLTHYYPHHLLRAVSSKH